MKLEKLIIENYRGYQSATEISFTDLTALIGCNDVGKTTILDALGVFFDLKICKYDISDKCVFSEENDDVRITCVFSELPEVLILDATSSTSLANEYLLNQDGNLELIRLFRKGKGSGVFLAKCRHPSSRNIKGIILKKNNELKLIAERMGIEVDDKRSNVSLREAIYAGTDELDLTLQEVSLAKEDGKTILEQIKQHLPHYALFRADRPSTDEEAEVQDPMKVAVSHALNDVADDLEAIKEKVREKAVSVATKTLEHLSDIDSNLASTLEPKFKADPKWDGIFKLTLLGDDGIPINKRGSGVRRLILISFFKAEAEKIKEEHGSKGVIYAIEEPETSQHPDKQKLLVESLSEISEESNCQVLITTHVPALAEQIPTQSLRYIHRNDAGDLVIRAEADDMFEKISKDLGVLPDSRVQVIVCLEGPNDIHFFKGMSRILGREGVDVPDFDNDPRLILLPLGGSTLKDWVNNNYLKNVGKTEVHIYDRDTNEPPTYQRACDKVNNRDDSSIAFLTGKREAENYLHSEAIKESLNIDIVVEDSTDIPKEVASSLGVNERTAKRRLNRKSVNKMSHARLVERDPDGELLGWFSEIQSLLS